jgi:hypothetical protein
MEPVMSTQQTQEAATPTQPVASSNTERIICNGCKLTLEENGTASDSVVVSFGNSLWHVDWSVYIFLLFKYTYYYYYYYYYSPLFSP